MDLISSFLDKFKKFEDPKKARGQIAKIISAELGEEISESAVTIKNKAIFLNINPMLKSQIFIKKEKILSAIKSEMKNIYAEDVR